MSKAKIAPTINNAGVLMKVTQGMDDGIHRYKATNLPPEVNGNSSCFSRLDLSRVADDHVIQNEKDADEYLRGFSPGFDFLVDDEMGDYDYYHDEDQF